MSALRPEDPKTLGPFPSSLSVPRHSPCTPHEVPDPCHLNDPQDGTVSSRDPDSLEESHPTVPGPRLVPWRSSPAPEDLQRTGKKTGVSTKSERDRDRTLGSSGLEPGRRVSDTPDLRGPEPEEETFHPVGTRHLTLKPSGRDTYMTRVTRDPPTPVEREILDQGRRGRTQKKATSELWGRQLRRKYRDFLTKPRVVR